VNSHRAAFFPFDGRVAILLLAFVAVSHPTLAAVADDFASRLADRTALERVYYDHRTGTKAPFAETMPPALLEQLTRLDVTKEGVLKKVYGVTITPAMLTAELARIDATTRAPDILADLKHALGNDPARLANALARPIVVERTLRARFDNDDGLHAARRKVAEDARTQALAIRDSAAAEKIFRAAKDGQVQEITWQLTPHPTENTPATAAPAPAATTVSAKSSTYAVSATAQVAQPMDAPAAAGPEQKFYFDDLDPELQKVLRTQLRQAGDVSAVIETPAAFLVYVAQEKTENALRAAVLSVPKRSYEDWLTEQSKTLAP